MRTCPACGEDTEASYAEACTKCGFSATGEQPAEAPPEITPAPVAADGDPPAEPEPPEPPEPAEPQERKKRSPGRLVIWAVIIAGFFGLNQLGIFDEPTGPSAEQVEESIVDSARELGVKVTVDCPDDAEDTEVGGTFTCTATTRRGESVEIVVTNQEDTFEWETGPLTTLS